MRVITVYNCRGATFCTLNPLSCGFGRKYSAPTRIEQFTYLKLPHTGTPETPLFHALHLSQSQCVQGADVSDLFCYTSFRFSFHLLAEVQRMPPPLPQMKPLGDGASFTPIRRYIHSYGYISSVYDLYTVQHLLYACTPNVVRLYTERCTLVHRMLYGI